MEKFQNELTTLINRCCIDNELATPDFILSEFVVNILKTTKETTMRREKWFGRCNTGPECTVSPIKLKE